MDKPNFEGMVDKLEEYSQYLKDNHQIGNSKLILAFQEMIRAMGWSSSQQDTNNIQIGNLTDELKRLRIDLKKYNDSANKESKRMLWLTVALGAVAILQVLIAVWQ